ncbi:MAG: coenzyme F420-0:L-glutamate ligase [Oscillospiraceae bacterium]|nr:coenzyme F420-0:L-glutamate ligase [Oscillospiraceae bacterium]
MSKTIGTISRGIKAPIIKQGDDLAAIIVNSVLAAADEGGFSLNDRDVIAATEAIAARAQGNYATIDDIAADIRAKFPCGKIGVIFPILSRNRFAICLKGIARGAQKITLMLNYPSDEVGNHLMDVDRLDASGVNPWTDTLTKEKYRELFGKNEHPFTGVDYVDYYTSIVEGEGAKAEIILANSPLAILEYAKNVLNCDIHTRKRTKRLLISNGAESVYSLDDILTAPVNGSGYNTEFGLLGTNKSTEEKVKLFPETSKCRELILKVQSDIKAKTGKDIEVMIYGDGAFKDPVGKIWELADPVISPAYTDGLNGTPNELKLKYLADNEFSSLRGDELSDAIRGKIKEKDADLKGTMATQGTTPRRYADLIGSLCDLTSGSGDKGTPIVLIQGYFDNFAD